MTHGAARFGIVALVLASGAALGQTAAPYSETRAPQARQALSAQQLTESIRHMIASPAPPTALEAPLLHGMGDAAARQITDILRGRAPLSATEQRNVVEIVHMAFEAPGAIGRTADRTPASSLALLRRIGADLRDPALQGRLAETQGFVTAASAAK